MNKYLLLIDGSSLLCTQYFGTEPLSTADGTPTNGVFGFMKVLSKIISKHNPSHLVVCWDVSRNTFRKEIFDDYKANRDETPNDLSIQFKICQELLNKMGIKQFFSNDYEADDYCGTISKLFENLIDVKIITKDKDYFQCLSEKTHIWKICNKKKDWQNLCTKYGLDEKTMPEKMFELTPDILKQEYGYSPDKVVFIKGLMGDSSDNIPGIEGIGEKSAIVLANKYANMTELYKDIESKTDEELDSWKKELKLRKNVIDSLKKKETKYQGQTNKDLGILSENLATIKRDIPLGDLKLEDLELHINSEEANKSLNQLEIKSIKF